MAMMAEGISGCSSVNLIHVEFNIQDTWNWMESWNEIFFWIFLEIFDIFFWQGFSKKM